MIRQQYFKNLTTSIFHNKKFGQTEKYIQLQNKHLFNYNSKKIKEKQEFTKLVFDKDNKSLIFFHINGETELRWIVRTCAAFTILNTFLTAQEYSYPIFGGWNGFSFGVCAFVGYGIMTALNVYSKRTVKSMYLFRSGDFVELNFFNAFWKPQSKVIHITEFANMTPSYLNYSRSELVTFGKIWINLEKSTYTGNKIYEDVLIEILNGKPQKLASPLANKAKNYSKTKF